MSPQVFFIVWAVIVVAVAAIGYAITRRTHRQKTAERNTAVPPSTPTTGGRAIIVNPDTGKAKTHFLDS